MRHSLLNGCFHFDFILERFGTGNAASGGGAKNFDDCFYSSVAGQLKISRTTDYNMVSEMAFAACSTEEQAIMALLAAYNVRRDMITAALIRIKLDLKKSIRDIAANPNKYLK
jgi:hypothetical protein